MNYMLKIARKYGGKIEIGHRTYRRFIPYPKPVTDGTCRCIQCGQIDEPEYHIEEACCEARVGMLAERAKAGAL